MKTLVLLFYVCLLFIITETADLLSITHEARWCIINEQELLKCEDLLAAIKQRETQYPNTFPSYLKKYDQLPALKCIKGADQFDCMSLIAKGKADLLTLDPGMGYTGGQFYNLMPIVAEQYKSKDNEDLQSYNAVAVINAAGIITDLKSLRGSKACFPGVGQAAGWIFPMAHLLKSEIMPVTVCNVPVKSANSFFGTMCAPDGLARYYNPFGNNPATICKNCKGSKSNFCTANDPYAGNMGALMCLQEKAGDVAFVRDISLRSLLDSGDASKYLLLCKDGSTASLQDSNTCNWGTISSHTIVTSEIHALLGSRNSFKELFKLLSYDFGTTGRHSRIFKLFDSRKYGSFDLMFSDATDKLVDVGDRDSYYSWAGSELRDKLHVLNMCPESQARWCVISPQEMSKCENMMMAFTARNLKPDLNCIMGDNVRDCMGKIKMGDADLITLDASDVYTGGRHFDLIPIAAEDYSGYDNAVYYAVAVARRTESHLTLFNLKNRRTCHSGILTAAGWILPVDSLIETGQIQVKDCDQFYHIGQFFSKSCVPGMLDREYDTYGTNPINLCEACASGGPNRCKRNNLELYYGNSGAFRCLCERGGDVAFVKHTTVRENTGSRNMADWARNRRSDDYELLCPNGKRKDIDDWKDCNLGRVPSNAIVTAGFKSKEQVLIYWTLINYAQQFFASDNNNDFNMFESSMNHRDLIFQDSTVRIIPVPAKEQNYVKYLGKSFVRAMKRNTKIDCVTGLNSGTHRVTSSALYTIVALFLCSMSFILSL